MAVAEDDEDGVWHVIPAHDLKEHESSEECWCNPVPDPEADGLVYIHHSLDGREREAH